MTEIDVTEILQKLPTRSDIINFFREQALYYPKNSHFSKAFLFGVLSGKKKLLPIGCIGGLNIPYYSKDKKLTKEHIYAQFINDENLMSYLPDNPDIRCISREFC